MRIPAERMLGGETEELSVPGVKSGVWRAGELGFRV